MFKIEPAERISLEGLKKYLQTKKEENYSSKNNCQKSTIESEVSTEEDPQFYIQQVQFIQSVSKEVIGAKYL